MGKDSFKVGFKSITDLKLKNWAESARKRTSLKSYNNLLWQW